MDVSNPDKVIFEEPGYTKVELVGYYEKVADRMLPWAAGRPLSLERYPNGVGAKGFMQKHASPHFSERIGRVEVPKSDGTVTHAVVSDAEGLMELANQGTITFHVWTARLPDLERPTHLVLDLDPEPGALTDVRRVAGASRETLEEFGLKAGLVASGRKGFHLWSPIEPAPYDAVGTASRALAGLVAIRNPDVATTEFRKVDREGRVFVDWLRNGRAQSIVSPWSLRASPRATVATPLEWEELETASPDGWTLETALDRRAVSQPRPAPLDVEAIVDAARAAGVDVEREFDRFGR